MDVFDDEEGEDYDLFGSVDNIGDGSTNAATVNDAKKKHRAQVRFAIFSSIPNHDEKVLLEQHGNDTAGAILGRYVTYFSRHRTASVESDIIKRVVPGLLEGKVTEKVKKDIDERHSEESAKEKE